MSPTEKLNQSWTVNEQLPVIYEERAHSSTDSGSFISQSDPTDLNKKESGKNFEFFKSGVIRKIYNSNNVKNFCSKFKCFCQNFISTIKFPF